MIIARTNETAFVHDGYRNAVTGAAVDTICMQILIKD